MIEHFDYFFGGHVEMTDLGFDGMRVDDRIETDEHLATVFDEALSLARLMEPLDYDTLWLAEHHFQREGYGGIANIPLLSVWLAGKTERLKFGAMFNTVPALASIEAGRRLCGRRHPDRGPGALRHRARLHQPRGGDPGIAPRRRRGQPRNVRGAGGDHLHGLEPAPVLPPRQILQPAAGHGLPRAQTEGPDPGAATAQRSGGMLAAHLQRQPARHRLHDEARHQGSGSGRGAGSRRSPAGGRRDRPPGGAGPSWGKTWSWCCR